MDKQEWMDAAYIRVRQIARWSFRKGFTAMTAEAIRSHMNVFLDLCPPSDLRWFGPVIKRCIREGVLARKGYAPAKSSHGALKARYVGTRHA